MISNSPRSLMLDNEAERDDLGDEFARELYGNPGFNNDIHMSERHYLG